MEAIMGFFIGGALVGGLIPSIIAFRKGHVGLGITALVAGGLSGIFSNKLPWIVGLVFFCISYFVESKTKKTPSPDPKKVCRNCHSFLEPGSKTCWRCGSEVLTDSE